MQYAHYWPSGSNAYFNTSNSSTYDSMSEGEDIYVLFGNIWGKYFIWGRRFDIRVCYYYCYKEKSKIKATVLSILDLIGSIWKNVFSALAPAV